MLVGYIQTLVLQEIQSGFLILSESEEKIFSRRIGLMVVDVLTFLKQLSAVPFKICYRH